MKFLDTLLVSAGIKNDPRDLAFRELLDKHRYQPDTAEAKRAINQCLDTMKQDTPALNRQLFKAIESGMPTFVKLVLEKNADPNAELRKGWRPIHHVIQHNYCHDGDEPKNALPLAILKMLLDRGADARAVTYDAQSVMGASQPGEIMKRNIAITGLNPLELSRTITMLNTGGQETIEAALLAHDRGLEEVSRSARALRAELTQLTPPRPRAQASAKSGLGR